MKNFFDHDTAKAVYYVYLYKNITKAGDKIGLTQSAMSRRIQMAEERTGLLIFERGYHEMIPTRQGARYIEACKEILHIGDAALKDAHELSDKPEGNFTLLTMPSLASVLMPKLLKDFKKEFPKISLQIREDKNPKDIFDSDAIIGYHQSNNEKVSQHLLFNQVQGIFASRSYIQKHGAPKDMSELSNHTLLAVEEASYDNNTALNWHLSAGLPTTDKKRCPSFTFGSNDGRYNAMREGLGIGVCGIHRPKLFGHEDLIQILQEFQSEKIGTYYTFNALARNNLKARLILDYLKKQISNEAEAFQF